MKIRFPMATLRAALTSAFIGWLTNAPVPAHAGNDPIPSAATFSQPHTRPRTSHAPDIGRAVSGDWVPGEILVKRRAYGSSVGDQSLGSLPGAKVRKKFSRIGWELVSLPPEMDVAEALHQLRNSPDVLDAEPNYRVRLLAAANDPRLSELWGLEKIEAPKVWSQATNTPRVVIGVIDSGINYRHPDLAANVWRNPGEIPGNGVDDDQNDYIDDIHGIDLLDKDGDPMDDLGHGTHIAGTIGAVKNNAIGAAGVSPEVQLIGLRIFSVDAFSTIAEAATAYEYAIGLNLKGVNLRVINNSWGGTYPSRTMKDAICTAADYGIISVCGAGNDHQNNDYKPFYPAGYDCPGNISVAASARSDEPAVFSNYGGTTVHLAAPGSLIVNAYKGAPDYATLSGTSVANAHVTGAVALLLAKKPGLTPADVRSILIRSVDRVPAWEGKVIANGRLNVAKAFENLTPPPSTPSNPRLTNVFTAGIRAASKSSQGVLGDLDSFVPSISGDGRYVVFASDATNLVPDDSNAAQDIFLHDRVSGSITKISRASTGDPTDDQSTAPSISDDGRFVVFHSLASNIVPGDANGVLDVFLYNRLTGQIELVSSGLNGAWSDGDSGNASISGDGRFIAFASVGANIVAGDNNRAADIFLRDMQEKTTIRINVAPGGIEPSAPSDRPFISRNSQFVAFHSATSQLWEGDLNRVFDVFVYDRNTSQIELVSRSSNDAVGNADSSFPTLSGDGRFVVFESMASNLDVNDVNGRSDVFLRDRELGQTRRISVSNTRTPGDENSFSPHISPDGRYVVFESLANALVPGLEGVALDLFLYDRLASRVTRLPFNGAGFPPSESSFAPRISGDGRYVAFHSIAFNLVPADGNASVDVFVFDRGAAPVDLSIRNTGETPFVGDGVIGRDVTQRKSQAVAVTAAATYELKIENPGSSENAFVLTAAGARPGWTVELYDAASGGRRITTDALSTGWTSPLLQPATNLTLRLEVTPQDLTTGERTLDIELAIRPAKDVAVIDAVHAVTYRPFSAPDRMNATKAIDGTPGNDNSYAAAISADGRYVAFASAASNLAPADFNDVEDVFLFDRVTQRTTAVSRTGNTFGNSRSEYPSISGDGRYIVFQSFASNLVPGDTNSREDIFIRDRLSGAILRVSLSTSRAQANRGSESAVISANGEWIAYQSLADNLVTGDTNSNFDIFLYNRVTRETTCASLAPNGETGNADSAGVAISADGSIVAFQSFASNLVTPDTNEWSDVFIYSRTNGTIELITRTPTGGASNGSSGGVSMSSDGNYILFASRAENLVPDDTNKLLDVFVYDRKVRRITRINPDLVKGTRHSISPDGFWIGFTTEGPTAPAVNASNRFAQVFLYNIQSGSLKPVSRTRSGNLGNEHSQSISFSGDSRLIAYESWASDLLAEKGLEASQILIADEGSFQPDTWVKRDGETTEIGKGSFSGTQSLQQAVSTNAAKTLLITLQNTSAFSDQLFVTTSAGGGPWKLEVFEAASGSNITQQVTGPGWTSASLASGEQKELRLVVQAETPADAAADSSQVINFNVASANDTNKVDALRIVSFFDSDNDDIGDAWERQYFNSLQRANASSDADGDGTSDVLEFRAGTDPLGATATAFKILGVERSGASSLRLRWVSTANRLYSVERSTRVDGGFTRIAERLSATPPQNVFQDTLPNNSLPYFYRIKEEP